MPVDAAPAPAPAPDDPTGPVREAVLALAHAHALLDDAVHAARSQGATWAQIAEATGMSRGWAHERWSGQGRDVLAEAGGQPGRGCGGCCRGQRRRGRGLGRPESGGDQEPPS